jgi:DNA-binding transcriptional MerR regulator
MLHLTTLCWQHTPTKPLTLECIQGLILSTMQRSDVTFHSGELAKVTGVSPDTIRHYERLGVLPKAVRSASGYRIYPQSAVERVRVVQRALRIGFTLSELAEVLKARDADGAPCQRVFELAQQKLSAIKTDIAALKQTEHYLDRVLTDWKSRVRQAGKGQKAHLLHSLTDGLKNVPGRTNFRRKR